MTDGFLAAPAAIDRDDVSMRRDSIPFDEILASLSNAVIVIDRQGVIAYVNEAYTRIMGHTADAVIGRLLQDVTPDSRMLSVLETGQPVACDVFSSKALGLDLVLNAKPLYREGRLSGAYAVFLNSRDLMEIYGTYRRSHGQSDYVQELMRRESRQSGAFAGLIGTGSPMSRVVALARRVAQTDATVLIRGENGVGKDVLARAIAQASTRCDGPFVSVNCAAIPDSLMESELFGFAPGSFTGAARNGRAGRFEQADGGTIFLDEVGDMSPIMQSKLLRVLQDRQIEKIGGNGITHVDVRVIAATNRDLERMVADGTFREDLFYRLNVFPLRLPPLRERKDDIPALVQAFVAQFCRIYARELLVAPETFELLVRHDWPGNVRQLRNAVERAVIMCDADVLLPEHLEEPCTEAPTGPPSSSRPASGSVGTIAPMQSIDGRLKEEIRQLELQRYRDALTRCGGNKTQAMKCVGVSRRTFYRRLRELKLM